MSKIFVLRKNTKEDFPLVGEKNILYVDQNTSKIFIWDGEKYILMPEDAPNQQSDFVGPLPPKYPKATEDEQEGT